MLTEPLKINFQEMMPDFGFEGRASIYEGPMPASASDAHPADSTRVLRVGHDWFVRVEWTQTGWLTWALGGIWLVRVYFERMGDRQFRLMSRPVEVPYVLGPGHRYLVRVSRSADQIVPEGLYKFTASLAMKGPQPAQRTLPIAAIAEGPAVQFYEAPEDTHPKGTEVGHVTAGRGLAAASRLDAGGLLHPPKYTTCIHPMDVL